MDITAPSICHFSCGSTSAVAALIELIDNPGTVLVYADPGAELEDNQRFLRDFELLTGRRVDVVRSKKFKDIYEVFVKKAYLSGIDGAPCTTEMKKLPIREKYGDLMLEVPSIFGFTEDEQGRIDNFIKNNPEIPIKTPLVDALLTKGDCMYILAELGIKMPEMYRLGYSNANCAGCVKSSSIGYWAAIRQDFPERFKWFANMERSIGGIDPETGKRKGASLCKKYVNEVRIRVFLDEIPADYPPKRNVSFSCGYSCGAQDMEETIENELTQPTVMGYIWLKNIQKSLNLKAAKK